VDEQARASLMREGIAAAQRGEREQASQLFSQLIEDDPNNASAWIWLSATSDDPDAALAAARNALAIEPNNEFAQQAERLALQAKEERSQGEQATTQQAQTENAAEATDVAATSATTPVVEQTDRSLLPPFLTQGMATQDPLPAGAPAPVTTRPLRSFSSRLEARTAVQTDQHDVEAAQRRRALATVAIVLVALLALAAIIYFGYDLISGQGNKSLTAQAEATATPLPSPTIPAVLRVTATALAVENAHATATADALNVTATAEAQTQEHAQQTFTAQTFPTTTPGPALLAYNQGLDAYNHQQYPQAATALEQAVQLDRHLILAHYYLGLTDLELAQAPVSQSAVAGTVLTPTVASTPISNTTVPTVTTPSSVDYYERAAIAFRNVTSLAPNWAGGYAGLADTYLRQSSYSEALPAAQQAIKLDSGRPEYYLLLGRIYDGLGRPADAKAAYDAAAGLVPPAPGSTPFSTPTSAPTILTAPPPTNTTPAASQPTAPPITTPATSGTPATPIPTFAGFEQTIVVP
jgi:tetratricopeptide (TPR) repeat protein